MKAPTRKAQQERSRRTAATLVSACIRVLDRDGLEACTVPRVAEAAKLAPATLYRRFPDKDALLQAAFLQVLRGNSESGREALEKALLRPTLMETAERAVAALLQQYREHPGAMRALQQYLQGREKGDFSTAAHKILATRTRRIAGVLLQHRERIRHDDAERATLFAVLTTSAALESSARDVHSVWNMLLPLNDKAIAVEHARAMVAYLRRKA